MDEPRVWDARYGRSSHLYSTLPGVAGHVELEEMARQLRLSRSWIQYPWTPREHYDVMKSCIDRAIAAGVKVVGWREFARCMRAKRDAWGK